MKKFHLNIKKTIAVFLGTFLLIISGQTAGANQVYLLGPDNATIDGSIKYTVVGSYHATFEEFNGKVVYDEDKNRILSVDLLIKAATIKSRFEKLDDIVRSKQILNVESYPEIRFKSEKVTEAEEGYLATGLLTLHGVTKEMTFPFSFESVKIEESIILNAKGKWVIPRKEFGVIWNKYLDKGGILVGNHITVDWSIEASNKEEIK